MKMKRNNWLYVAGLLLLSLASCNDDVQQQQFTFNATMEQLQNADNNGKIQLVNEQWTFWEIDDSINLVSNASTVTGGKCDLYTGWLINGGSGDYSDYDGVFISSLTEQENKHSQWFVAIHPADYQHHQITYSGTTNHGFSAKVYLDAVQHYRHDSSYARQLLPMIATYDGPAWESGTEPYRLDFHSLAGLVRLQIVNGTGSAENISKIELESLAPTGGDTISQKPLCGLFPVKSLYRFNAHLDPDPTAVINPGYTLTLSTSGTANTGSLPFNPNDLKSFYVVLPAFHGMDTTTYFHLRMTVYTTNNTKCSKSFTVSTRRNGITYMRAININAFDDATGSGSPVLVGNGTSNRPFKIYSYNDLLYLRECFNHPVGGSVYVNGQLVTPNTHFRIMRSDIKLDANTWNEGIKNFVGTITYIATGTASQVPGITNNTNVPLFHNISVGGKVSGLTLRCGSINAIQYTNNNGSFSPFCNLNNGIIENCKLANLTDSTILFQNMYNDSTCFAGICSINEGTIRGCGCTATGTYSAVGGTDSRAMFAGICYRNTGLISECYAASGMSVGGNVSLAAGICFDNKGTVQDCYYAARITVSTAATTSWGAIVYRNTSASANIIHCYSSDNSMLVSNNNSSMGGIVCEHHNGTIDYCWSEAQMKGAKVGGIATTVSGGTLQNCFIDDSLFLITLNDAGTAHYAGGLAAEMTGGTINNSFGLIYYVSAQNLSSVYGSVVGNLTGGTINNCYGLEVAASNAPFYGVKTGGTLNHCHLLHGTQTGVDGITTVNATTLESLKNNLNANIPTGGITWIRGSGDQAAPYLNNPYSTSKKR